MQIRPENEQRLRNLITEGRLLIGPWYNQPDEFLVSGESLIRKPDDGQLEKMVSIFEIDLKEENRTEITSKKINIQPVQIRTFLMTQMH